MDDKQLKKISKQLEDLYGKSLLLRKQVLWLGDKHYIDQYDAIELKIRNLEKKKIEIEKKLK